MKRGIHALIGAVCMSVVLLGVNVVPALASAPKVSTFSPAAGPAGSKVTVTGIGFSSVKSVKLNGVSAPFKVSSTTKLSFTVPASATTGKVSVTTSGGTGVSTASFSVSPLVKTLLPASGVVGGTVTIGGATFTGTTAVAFNGVPATFSVLSSSQISATVPAGATTGKVSVTTPSGTGQSASAFRVAPAITNLTPNTAAVGASIVITGTRFNGASAVAFNGTAASFTLNSATQITAVVPAGATTGKVSVTTPSGTAQSATSFTVAPKISAFTPTLGPVGTSVTITGTTFNGASSVTFNGVSAFFSLVSPSQIVATVPATASTGLIQVTTPGGVASSAAPFSVTPVINSFSPQSGPVGTSVTITGTTFVSVTGVLFNGQSAAYTVNSPTQITATVPPSTSGPIEVITTSGAALSASSFTVTPSVVLSSSSGSPTSTITVNGYGFGAGQLVDVYFDNQQVAFAGTDQTGSFTGVPLQVPASALPGAHTISLIERGATVWARTAFEVNTDWAQWRGGARHTGYNPFENVIGVGNVAALDLAWSSATGGPVQSSPTLVGGTLYVGSNDGKLYTFDASTGAAGWSTNLGAAVAGTPAVVGGTVYVGAANGTLSALDASTGSVTWTATVGGTLTSPVVDAGVVYVGSSSGVVNAYTASNGSPLWSAAIGSAVASAPAVANGLVVFGTNGSKVEALHANNGGVAWTFTTGGAVSSSPAIVGGTVYVGSKDTNVYALNVSTGAQVWSVTTGGQVNSSPAVANGVVYIGSNDTNLYALSAVDGSTLWTAGPSNGSLTGGVTVANGVVYFGSNDGNVYAVDTNGNSLWRAATGSAIVSTPTVANGTVYVSSNDGSLRAFR